MAVSFDKLNCKVRDKFGVNGTYTPAAGVGRTVKVVIERDYFSETPGVGIQTEKLMAKAVTDDISEINVGDSFDFAVDEITGSFEVVEVRHDYLGMTDLILNRA